MTRAELIRMFVLNECCDDWWGRFPTCPSNGFFGSLGSRKGHDRRLKPTQQAEARATVPD